VVASRTACLYIISLAHKIDSRVALCMMFGILFSVDILLLCFTRMFRIELADKQCCGKMVNPVSGVADIIIHHLKYDVYYSAPPIYYLQNSTRQNSVGSGKVKVLMLVCRKET